MDAREYIRQELQYREDLVKIADLLDNQAQAEAELSASVQRTAAENAKYESLQRANMELESKIADAQARYDADVTETARLLSLVKTRAANEAAAKLAEAQADVDAQVAAMKAQIPALAARAQELEAEIATLESRKVAAQQALDLLKRA